MPARISNGSDQHREDGDANLRFHHIAMAVIVPVSVKNVWKLSSSIAAPSGCWPSAMWGMWLGPDRMWQSKDMLAMLLHQ